MIAQELDHPVKPDDDKKGVVYTITHTFDFPIPLSFKLLFP
jgi:hypothetical protein